MAAGAPPTYSVSQVLELLRVSLTRAFPSLCVSGEVVDPFMSHSGHFYLRLRDGQGELKVVMWRREAQRLRSYPKAGDRVLVRGGLTVYPSKGELQMQAVAIAKEGQGEKLAELAALKEALRAEGLFDRPRKALPFLPRRLGVVTSVGSAVLHDIFQCVRRRNPAVEVWLSPSAVSGASAPAELIQALEYLRDKVDAVIVARGGGSFEELLVFSDERLVRAVVDYPVPVVSAIGHGSDSTLLDLVADGTAPTPTAAAELATPVRDELLSLHAQARQRMMMSLGSHLGFQRAQLATLSKLCQSHRPQAQLMRDRRQWELVTEQLLSLIGHRLAESRRERDRLADRLSSFAAGTSLAVQHRTLSEWASRLQRAQERRLDEERQRLVSLRQSCRQLGPGEVLRRGFAMVLSEGNVVTTVAGRRPGEELELQLADGHITVLIQSVSRQTPVEVRNIS